VKVPEAHRSSLASDATIINGDTFYPEKRHFELPGDADFTEIEV
jgi:hypothetical protein